MTQKITLDTAKIPFVFNPEKSVQQQGNDMAIFLQSLAASSFKDKTWYVVKTCLDFCKVPSLSPLYNIAKDVSDLIDKDTEYGMLGATYSGQANGYHNARHMQEVVLNAMFLIAIMNAKKATMPLSLSVEEQGLLLFSALIHDLGHDGSTNYAKNKTPYKLEKNSVDLVRPIAQKYMDKKDLNRFMDNLTAIICTTDNIASCASMEKLLDFHHNNGRKKSVPLGKGAIAPEFMPLASSVALFEVAAMLCDADIAGSIAYNFSGCWEASMRLIAELAPKHDEREEEIALKNLVYFLENLACFKSYAGQVLQSNFEVIRNNAQTLLIALQMRKERKEDGEENISD